MKYKDCELVLLRQICQQKEYKDFGLVLLRQICQRNYVLNYASGNGLGTKSYLTSFASCQCSIIISYRSSHRRCSVKKLLLEISQNSQENTCARVSFLTKLKSFSEHLRTTASKISIKFKSQHKKGSIKKVSIIESQYYLKVSVISKSYYYLKVSFVKVSVILKSQYYFEKLILFFVVSVKNRFGAPQ